MSEGRSLKYYPDLDMDRLGDSKMSGFSALNSTLAQRQTSPPKIQGGKVSKPGEVKLYLHANSQVKALEDGRDVSDYFRLLRLRRQWQVRLPESIGDEPASGYELQTKATSPLFPPGFGEDFGDSWFDAPGESSVTVDDVPGQERILSQKLIKDYGNGYRALQEFIVFAGVKEAFWKPVTSFGGLHFVTAVDVRKTRYRVMMSGAVVLTMEELEGTMSPEPKDFPHRKIGMSQPPEPVRFPGTVFSPWYDYRGIAK